MTRKKEQFNEAAHLAVNHDIRVRFNETDPLGIVWHGHYIRYFEDGRESFGKQHGIGYLAFYENGYVIPVVNAQCDYKKSLRYGDTVRVETEYIPTEAAKMLFKYRLFKVATNELFPELFGPVRTVIGANLK